MGETTAQIETHIQHSREDLQSNLKELEHKVKSFTDWRQQFQNHPGIMLGAALGGGLLLSLMIGRRKTRLYASAMASRPRDLNASKLGNVQGQVQSNLNEIKGALISLGATQVKGFIAKLIPGFEEHLSHTDRESVRSTDNAVKSTIPHWEPRIQNGR